MGALYTPALGPGGRQSFALDHTAIEKYYHTTILYYYAMLQFHNIILKYYHLINSIIQYNIHLFLSVINTSVMFTSSSLVPVILKMFELLSCLAIKQTNKFWSKTCQ